MKTIQVIMILATLVAFAAPTQADDNKVARVIYSEASGICTPVERYLVASVIKNRIKHVGFNKGKLKNMLNVVSQKNAFECINHSQNTNWKASKYMRPGDDEAYDHAIVLSTGRFTAAPDYHFFLTKGTVMPRNMISKKYWTIEKLSSTKHFDFYSIKARLI